MSALVNDPAWHAARSRVVGGSEIAALFGCQQPYQMALYELWHVKAGLVSPPEVEGERIEWGNDLEDAIAHVAARRHGWEIKRGGHIPDPECPGLGCTRDYWIKSGAEFPGLGVLEIKNVDWLQHRSKWTDGEPPAHILLQLQVQLACTGCEWGYVGALIGGNKLEIYPFVARPKIIAEIRKRVAAFWHSIEVGAVPQIDGSDGAFRTLRELHPAPVDEEIDLSADEEFAVACAELATATEQRKAAEKIEAAARARIIQALGDHKRGAAAGWRASLSVTPAKPDREALPGEIIKGRAETRRLTVKEWT